MIPKRKKNRFTRTLLFSVHALRNNNVVTFSQCIYYNENKHTQRTQTRGVSQNMGRCRYAVDQTVPSPTVRKYNRELDSMPESNHIQIMYFIISSSYITLYLLYS